MLLQDWLLDPLGLLLLWTLVLFALNGWRSGRSRRVKRSGRSGRSTRPERRFAPVRTLFCFLAWWAGLAGMSAPAIVNPLVAAHENRVAAGECLASSAVVVLGGGVDSRIREASRFDGMSSATLARVAEAARLADPHPEVMVVLAGGASAGTVAEADVMAGFLERLGISPARIVRETRSTSTVSNARQVAALALLAERPTVRLVTSALHMPRAVAAFEAAGLSVCAVPVDRLAVDAPGWALWPQTSALHKFDRWFHEQLGLLLHRPRGEA